MSPHPSEHAVVREELRLACAELERRLRDGQGRAEDLLQAFPRLQADHESALELIYTEFVLRQELGQRPSPPEWYARFPQWGGDLIQLFEVHRFACAGLSDTHPTGVPSGSGLVGRRLGAYELLSELGRGGMGVVFKARQTALDRLVAVKLILTGDYSGPRERARFRTEAEAIARLDHPNIIHVHEVGEHDGRPFYSMEYVTGGHLAERLQGDAWPSAEAVGLVRTLALAVEHAHQRGIVHRDLKPANILLTADGTPKITDFGLARRLPGDDRKTVLAEGRTQSGAILGSPQYMAPEQAGGERREITPAADVYALGSILYELLTGRPPFHGSSVLEILDQVRASEPAAPRKLVPGLPRDLETVCLKCLRKQPQNRYASAADLAEDLRRFQAGEPVVARPVGGLERAAKWARRKPAVAAMLGVVAGLLAVMVAGVALAFQALRQEQVRTAKQRDLTEGHLEQARKAEAEARENLEQARKAVDECFGLARDDPLLQAESLRKVRRLLLGKTLPFYKGFVERTPNDPALAARQAEYLFKVAFITQEIGSKVEALASFDQARASYARLSEAYPGVAEYQAGLGRSWINLATMKADMGRFPEARAGFERAVSILGRLAEARPDITEYRGALAAAWDNLGLVQNRTGGQAQALHSLGQARDLRRKLTQERPEFVPYQVALARTYKHLGHLLGRTGKPAEGRDNFEKALSIFRQLEKGPLRAAQHRAEFANTLTVLSELQLRTRKRAEAERNARQAVAMLSALHRAFPEVTQYQANLAEALEHLADTHLDLNDRVKCFEQAGQLRRRLTQADPEVGTYLSGLARNYARLGALQLRLKRHQDALKTCGEARALQEKLCAADPRSAQYRSDLATTCTTLGGVLRGLERKDEALESYHKALALLLGLTEGKPPVPSYQLRLGLLYYRLGLLLCDTGRAEESLGQFARGIATVQNVVGRPPDLPPVPLLRDNHWGRARALNLLGRHREAAADWAEAARLDSGPIRPRLLAWQALSLARAGDYAEAGRLAGPLDEPADLPGALLFDLARVHALSAGACGRDSARPLAERERRGELHARQAVLLLERVAQTGFFRDSPGALSARSDPAFEAVRRRDDYRCWLAALQ